MNNNWLNYYWTGAKNTLALFLLKREWLPAQQHKKVEQYLTKSRIMLNEWIENDAPNNEKWWQNSPYFNTSYSPERAYFESDEYDVIQYDSLYDVTIVDFPGYRFVFNDTARIREHTDLTIGHKFFFVKLDDIAVPFICICRNSRDYYVILERLLDNQLYPAIRRINNFCDIYPMHVYAVNGYTDYYTFGQNIFGPDMVNDGLFLNTDLFVKGGKYDQKRRSTNRVV